MLIFLSESTAPIVGGVVGGVLLVAIVIAVVCVIMRKRRGQSKEKLNGATPHFNVSNVCLII